MPKNINPIKKELVKQALKAGNSQSKALLAGGYSKATAMHRVRKDNRLLNVVKEEIAEELRMNDITLEFVLNRLNQDRDLCISKKDFSGARECDIWIGKMRAAFTDRIVQKIEYTPQEQDELNVLRQRYIQPIVIDPKTCENNN